MADKIQKNSKNIVPRIKNCKLSYNQFSYYLKQVQKHYMFYLDVSDGGMYIDYPIMIDEVVDLLTILCGDEEEEWIDYWVFELKCGRTYHNGNIRDDEGKFIPLKTIDDLWNLINTRYK